jgi:hypothetical protein
MASVAPAAAPSTLPTRGEIRRATDRFLAAEASAPDRGSGGQVVDGAPAPLPESRVVAFYGAPQMGRTILGLRSPLGAARSLARQARPYADLGDRPVVGEFDLVSVFANAAGGPDGLYRTRQSDEVIEIYLAQARAAGARLMLDIQPGRSTFIDEVRSLRRWVAQPDVDVALDPEWNVGPRGVPGRTEGRVRSREVNAVIRSLAATVKARDLPPKLLVVHQFRRGMVRGRRQLRSRDGVQTVLNFDGIGSPRPKESGYAALASPRLFNGFSLFYRRDTPLMDPADVLRLDPEPDFLLYQ